MGVSSVPNIEHTPTTREVLDARGPGREGGHGGGPGDGGGPGGGGMHPALKGSSQHVSKRPRWGGDGGHLAGVPMARSGVSDLVGGMSLNNLAAGGGLGGLVGGKGASSLLGGGEGGGSGCGEGGSGSSAGMSGGAGLSESEADRMQREADAYVQVITAGDEPFQIVWASEAWLRLCEYTPPQVLGHTLELIQGPMTDRDSVASLMNATRHGEPITLSMINHTRTGKPFSHTLRVEPLRDSRGNVQCFQATSSNIDESVGCHGSQSAPPPSLSSLTSQPASRTISNQLLGNAVGSLESPSLGPASSASPPTSIGEGEDTLGAMGGMRRNDSAMSISGMLARSESELQISEMLDLFDQQNGGTPKQSPRMTPRMTPISAEMEGGSLSPTETTLLGQPLRPGEVAGDEAAGSMMASRGAPSS